MHKIRQCSFSSWVGQVRWADLAWHMAYVVMKQWKVLTKQRDHSRSEVRFYFIERHFRIFVLTLLRNSDARTFCLDSPRLGNTSSELINKYIKIA